MENFYIQPGGMCMETLNLSVPDQSDPADQSAGKPAHQNVAEVRTGIRDHAIVVECGGSPPLWTHSRSGVPAPCPLLTHGATALLNGAPALPAEAELYRAVATVRSKEQGYLPMNPRTQRIMCASSVLSTPVTQLADPMQQKEIKPRSSVLTVCCGL